MHRLNLRTGDWSDDGHGKTDVTPIESSLNRDEIWKAYEKGCKIIGFDLVEEIATDYEDSELKMEYYKRLLETGFNKNEFDLYDEDEPDFQPYVDQNNFPKIFLHVVKLGDPNFEYKISSSRYDFVEIGGYGLFS